MMLIEVNIVINIGLMRTGLMLISFWINKEYVAISSLDSYIFLIY